VKELARNHYIPAKENVLICGNSGTGKTHIATALGISACEAGYRVRFTTTHPACMKHSFAIYRTWCRISRKRLSRLCSSARVRLLRDMLKSYPMSQTASALATLPGASGRSGKPGTKAVCC
jgi:phosphate starvation-inducible protein PhoH